MSIDNRDMFLCNGTFPTAASPSRTSFTLLVGFGALEAPVESAIVTADVDKVVCDFELYNDQMLVVVGSSRMVVEVRWDVREVHDADAFTALPAR